MTEISEIHALLARTYLEVHRRAYELGLPTNNIIIRCRGELKEALGLGDIFPVGGFGIPVVADDEIKQRRADNGNSLDDVYIYDENWGEVE